MPTWTSSSRNRSARRRCVSTPRTVFGGSIVKNGLGSHPEEVYVCPRGFDGEYVLRVDPIANDEKKPTLSATLEIITHEGTPEEHKETHTLTLPKSGKPSEPWKFTLSGGRRKRRLAVPRAGDARPDRPGAQRSSGRGEGHGTKRRRRSEALRMGCNPCRGSGIRGAPTLYSRGFAGGSPPRSHTCR